MNSPLTTRQRHRHFAGVLPQVPHLSGESGILGTRILYGATGRLVYLYQLKLVAIAMLKEHCPGITDAGRCKRRTLKARSCTCNTSPAVRIFRVYPQAALLFCCCSGDAAAAWRLRGFRTALRDRCSLACVRLSTFHLVRSALRFLVPRGLYSFGAAAWYSKSTRACAKQAQHKAAPANTSFSSINS